MKKKNLLLIALSTIITSTLLAQNTFPTNGNVGIGTTSPQSDLHVKGDVKIDSTLDISGDLNVDGGIHLPTVNSISSPRGNGMLVTDGSGNLKKVPYDSLMGVLKSDMYAAPIPFDPCLYAVGVDPHWSSGTNKLYVACPDVFVGVGTHVPQTNLDVRGVTYTDKLAINADPTTMDSKLFHLKIDNSTSANASVFLVENDERSIFQINNDGIARSREIIVDAELNWPDYVFEPSYELMPLEEVEKFIETNGHLPNVPSAREVESDGIKLGAINTILMEKIEELTLHLIEQQKLIEAQQIQLEEQRKVLEELQIKTK